MPTPLTRRPRFLAAVPAAPDPEPAPFARVHAPRPPPPGTGAPHAAAPEVADHAEARREALERVGQAVEMLRAQSERLAEQARSDALELGFLVARRLLEAEIRQSPEAVISLVRSALRKVGDSRRVTVRLSPEDAALLQSEGGPSALEGLSASRVEYQPDAALERGDCIVETDFGRVDGRIATRLGELRRSVDLAAGGGAA